MVESELQVIDTIDMEIIMHREAHFGSSFEVMLEYYEQGGVGRMRDFEVTKIRQLQSFENRLGQNLAKLYLPSAAREVVDASKQLYQDLREAYAKEAPESLAILLSDLILSEEEYPEQAIKALVARGEECVPPLIHLLSSPTFSDPLYPGYGRAPIFVARCLAAVQDKRAISPLFEALGEDNFFTDEEIIKAIASFGEISKHFLLNILKQTPHSKDNEHAAIALNGFPEDEEIASSSLEVLERENTLHKPSFSSYLIFLCAPLAQKSERERFIAISRTKNLPKQISDEMAVVIKNWKVS